MCLNRCITLKSPLLEPVREDGAETFNIDPEGRFDALHGGNARWRARIDAIKLVDITPTIIQKWKRGVLDRAGNDPMALRATERQPAGRHVDCRGYALSLDLGTWRDSS